MHKSAIISDCGKYRYQLLRYWDTTLPSLVFIMLNPSTADANKDDPTVKKCMGFAEHNGYGGIEVMNLFAYRATDPKELKPLGEAIRIGPDNDEYLKSISPFSTVVAAWGMNPYKHPIMSLQVNKVLGWFGSDMYCVRKSEDRPWHPLYVPYGELIKLGVA